MIFLIPVLVEFINGKNTPFEMPLQGTIVGYNPTTDMCYVCVETNSGPVTYPVKKHKVFKVEIPLGELTYGDLVISSSHLITDGWEIYSHIIDKFYQVLKIRKKYSFDEPHYNEDGYKYNNLYVGSNAIQNKYLKSKGYKLKYD